MPKRVRLPPTQVLHQDRMGRYYLGRPKCSLLVPLASCVSEVEPETLNFLRPEMAAKLTAPLSPVPGPEFCPSCVVPEDEAPSCSAGRAARDKSSSACHDPATLKQEIVDAYDQLQDVIDTFVEDLNAAKMFPLDCMDLRKWFHQVRKGTYYLLRQAGRQVLSCT